MSNLSFVNEANKVKRETEGRFRRKEMKALKKKKKKRDLKCLEEERKFESFFFSFFLFLLLPFFVFFFSPTPRQNIWEKKYSPTR